MNDKPVPPHRGLWGLEEFFSAALRSLSALVIRCPGGIVAGVFLLIVCAALHLCWTPFYIDTSISAFYSRANPIADRVNAEYLNQYGPPGAVVCNGTLRDEVISDVLSSSGYSASTVKTFRSNGIDKSRDGRQELHVLATAHGGGTADVFEVGRARQLCRAIEATMALASERGACKKHLPAHYDAETCPDGSACYQQLPCAAPWSMFNLHESLVDLDVPAITAGLELLSRAAQLPQSSLEQGLGLVKRGCAAGVTGATGAASGGLSLCALPTFGCDGDECSASGKCFHQGLDVCAVFTEIQPSTEELVDLARLPTQPLTAQGCAALDASDLLRTLRAASVLKRWSQRSALIPTGGLLDYFVDRHFGGDGSTPLRSSVTRVVVKLLSHPHHNSQWTPAEEDAVYQQQRLRSRSFVEAWSQRVLPKYNTGALLPKYNTGGLSLVYRQWDYFSYYTDRQVLLDVRWAAGSMLFLLAYMGLQTGSAVTTVGVVAGILGSLPLSLWLYRFAFGIDWSSVLTFIAIFIILGIGADDAFVILEYWKFSRFKFQGPAAKDAIGARTGDHDDDEAKADDELLQERMFYTLQHAFSAITSTSLTTAAAFAANAFSHITPFASSASSWSSS